MFVVKVFIPQQTPDHALPLWSFCLYNPPRYSSNLENTALHSDFSCACCIGTENDFFVYLLIMCAGKQMSPALITWAGEVCFRVCPCNHKILQYKQSLYKGITCFLLGCGWRSYSLQLCPLSPCQRPPRNNCFSGAIFCSLFKSFGFCMSPVLKGQAGSRGWSVHHRVGCACSLSAFCKLQH